MAKTSQLNEADVLDFLDVGVNIANDINPGDPISKARIRVTLDQLRPYDNNPRQSENPKFDSILASIESRGLDHPPNITRRYPNDEHYIIIDGGNTRLEILNILYDKYKMLMESATTDVERLAYHEKAQSFYTIDCTFKPWQGESHTLAGHMSENEERGDTLFIEKALAVQAFRRIYEEEDRAVAEANGDVFEDSPLTVRALAERITAQGWTISYSHLSRFEYAANQLLPVIPSALWAGAGQPLIINLRRLEKAYSAFWATTDAGRDNPQVLLDLFYQTLADADDETVDVNGIAKEMDRALGEMLDLPAMTVCAEVGAFTKGVRRTPEPESAMGDTGRNDFDAEQDDENPQTGAVPSGHSEGPTKGKGKKPSTPAPSRASKPDAKKDAPVWPGTPEELQEAVVNEVLPLAAQYSLMLDRIELGVPSKGCNWFVVRPIDKKGGHPLPGKDDAKAAMWWALYRLSNTYRQLSSSHNAFQKAFQHYLADGMPVIDMVLRLSEFEAALPKEAQAHLANIKRLVDYGDATFIDQK